MTVIVNYFAVLHNSGNDVRSTFFINVRISRISHDRGSQQQLAIRTDIRTVLFVM